MSCIRVRVGTCTDAHPSPVSLEINLSTLQPCWSCPVVEPFLPAALWSSRCHHAWLPQMAREIQEEQEQVGQDVKEERASGTAWSLQPSYTSGPDVLQGINSHSLHSGVPPNPLPVIVIMTAVPAAAPQACRCLAWCSVSSASADQS